MSYPFFLPLPSSLFPSLSLLSPFIFAFPPIPDHGWPRGLDVKISVGHGEHDNGKGG